MDLAFRYDMKALSSQVNHINASENGSSTEGELNILEQYNHELLLYQLPAIIYASIMMMLGLPGNTIVFYVYLFKWRRSTSRVFILFLAALDMVNCATTIPMEIYIMRFSVMLDQPFLCKISRFATYTMNSSSALILVGIAVDRFKRICRPYQKSFSEENCRWICIAAIVFSLSMTWPALFLYGTRIIDLGSATGKGCLLENKFDYAPYPVIFFGLFASMTLVIFTVLSILYYFVGMQIYRHRSFKLRKCTHVQKIVDEKSVTVKSENGKASNDKSKHSSSNEAINIVKTNSIPQIVENQVSSTPDIREENLCLSPYRLVPEVSQDVGTSCGLLGLPSCNSLKDLSDAGRSMRELSTCEVSVASTYKHEENAVGSREKDGLSKTERDVSPTKRSPVKKVKPKVKKKTRRVRYMLVRGASTLNQSGRTKCTDCLTVRIGRSTYMLFLITLAYIISFLPFYIVAIIRQSDSSFVAHLSKAGHIAYHVFLRSYLLSSAINPIIYSFCNAQFREFVQDLFRGVFIRRRDSSTKYNERRRFRRK